MPSYRYQLFILLVAGLCIIQVKNEKCSISLPSDPTIRPLFERTFGSRTILKPYNSLKKSNSIYAEKGETIVLHCFDGFSLPLKLTGQVSIKLTCLENGIFEATKKHISEDQSMYWPPNIYHGTTTHHNYHDNRNLFFECKKFAWNLYESSDAFRWCPEFAASYIIAKKNVNKSPTHIAGLCYDTERLILSSVAYNIQPDEFKISKRKKGNWKKYRNALEKHTAKAAYNVISGIGGKLEVPDSSGCDNTTEMKVLVDKYDRHIPAYIWNYLESLQSTSKEFAIIAFNSPFYEFYEEGDIVFCEDICHKINWLANVRSTFQYANMGVMFCCELDDVQKSEHLDNFPKKNDAEDDTKRRCISDEVSANSKHKLCSRLARAGVK
uniref:DNA/RNA non-specific endonuclease domain-containing protein n=1 Tax=Glossina pallidipes TaxID=7398 RepID=A0A1A9Z805_GLOPL